MHVCRCSRQGYGSSVAPTYINEVSPRHLRGTLGVSFQFGVVLILFIAQVISLKPVLGSETTWHYALGRNSLSRCIRCDADERLPRLAHYLLRPASGPTFLRTRESEVSAAEEERSRWRRERFDLSSSYTASSTMIHSSSSAMAPWTRQCSRGNTRNARGTEASGSIRT